MKVLTTISSDTPGPSSYQLPTLVGQARHDPSSTRPKGPAWSIGGRNDFKANKNPSPAHYLPSITVLSNKQTNPAWSLSGRHKDNPDNLPGPGHYAPEKSPPKYNAGHSFGGKHKDLTDRNKPGPANYYVPPDVSRTGRTSGPHITLSPRSDPGKHKGPGPADYDPHDEPTSPRRKEPAYSFGKIRSTANNTNPAPNAYYPDARPIKDNAPSYSLGSKAKFRPNKNPGPADYKPEPEVIRYGRVGGSRITMKSRLSEYRENTPAPGTYRPENSTQSTIYTKAPAYSFGMKTPTHNDNIPGPASYRPEDSISVVYRADPAWSLGHKLQGKPPQTPGPADYQVSSKTSHKGTLTSPAYSVGSPFYVPIKKGPGPADYSVDYKLSNKGPTTSPAYSLGSQLYLPVKRSPGPADYYVPSYFGPGVGLSYSLGSLRDGYISTTPGPGTYYPELSGRATTLQAPLYSFGYKKTRSLDGLQPEPAGWYSAEPTIAYSSKSSVVKMPGYTITEKGQYPSSYVIPSGSRGTTFGTKHSPAKVEIL